MNNLKNPEFLRQFTEFQLELKKIEDQLANGEPMRVIYNIPLVFRDS